MQLWLILELVRLDWASSALFAVNTSVPSCTPVFLAPLLFPRPMAFSSFGSSHFWLLSCTCVSEATAQLLSTHGPYSYWVSLPY